MGGGGGGGGDVRNLDNINVNHNTSLYKFR